MCRGVEITISLRHPAVGSLAVNGRTASGRGIDLPPARQRVRPGLRALRD